ncbi:MAG: hypothetical protein A2Y38_03305 [Spirochaetes bacterium GWB1_59_5]|nr:MAG: hypothetical protein A2Y38_03305 [Spirochaetes bacterium GWB1_59_5]
MREKGSIFKVVRCYECGTRKRFTDPPKKLPPCKKCGSTTNEADKFWSISYSFEGKQIAEQISIHKKQAEDRLNQVLGQIVDDRFKLNQKKERLTWDKAAELYKTHLEGLSNSDTRDFYIQRLYRNLTPFFREFSWKTDTPLPKQLSDRLPVYIQDLLPQHLQAYMVYCRDDLGHSNSTVNRARTTLINMINCFVKSKIVAPDNTRYLEYNQLQVVPAWPENDSREDKFYTVGELNRLSEAAEFVDKRAPLIIGFGAFGGLRRKTICSLKKEYLNLQENLVSIPASKRKQGDYTHYLDMIPRLRGLLDSYLEGLNPKEQESPWLFCGETPEVPISRSYWDNIFRKVKKEAGLEDKRFHDTKHSAGTFYYQATQDIRKTADFLDHSDINMSRKYAFVSREQKRKDAEKFGQKFE